jgi:hypothetical protein
VPTDDTILTDNFGKLIRKWAIFPRYLNIKYYTLFGKMLLYDFYDRFYYVHMLICFNTVTIFKSVGYLNSAWRVILDVRCVAE